MMNAIDYITDDGLKKYYSYDKNNEFAKYFASVGEIQAKNTIITKIGY